MHIFQFFAFHAEATLVLQRLLRFQVLPGSKWHSTPIGMATREPVELWNARKPREALASLGRLGLLTKQLNELGKHEPDVLRRLRPRLCGPRLDTYLGARCEALVASALVRRGPKFVYEKPGAPDFLLSDGVGLECTSVHLTTGPKDRDLGYKLASAVRRKATKPYASMSTAVVVEQTPVASLQSDDDANAAVESLAPLVLSTGLGSVILCSQLLDLDGVEPVYRSVYNRLDNSPIDSSLVAVLDLLYPRSPRDVEQCTFPATP